jgi:hypothetical protein
VLNFTLSTDGSLSHVLVFFLVHACCSCFVVPGPSVNRGMKQTQAAGAGPTQNSLARFNHKVDRIWTFNEIYPCMTFHCMVFTKHMIYLLFGNEQCQEYPDLIIGRLQSSDLGLFYYRLSTPHGRRVHVSFVNLLLFSRIYEVRH